MKQLTVHLEDEQHLRLKRYAVDRGVSMSDLIRSVCTLIAESEPEYDLLLSLAKHGKQAADRARVESDEESVSDQALIPEELARKARVDLAAPYYD